MSKVCIFLAAGFEEIEGLTVVDLLRRAGIDIKMISIGGTLGVTGSHGIYTEADLLFTQLEFEDTDMLVLPGGMPGTLNLGKHEGLQALLKEFHEKEKKIAAICAAPSILGDLGILEGHEATCYPGFEERLTGAKVLTDRVVVSGHITTSRGMGTAIPFALSLIEQLAGKEEAEKIRASIIYGHTR